MAVAKKELIACAKDLNESISDEVLVKGSPEDITESIKDCAEILEESDEDELKESTIETLTALGFWEFGEEEPPEEDEEPPKKKKKTAKKKPAPESEEEPEEDPEDEAEEDEAEEAPKKKKKKKPAPVEDEDPDEDPDEDEAPKKKKKEKKEKKEKGIKTPSPYGTTVELVCTDPDITMVVLKKKLVKKGINLETGKAGIQTGFGVVRKIVGLLRENGHME